MDSPRKFSINEKTEKAWETYKDNQDNILGHWNQRGTDYIEPKCKNIDNRTQLDNDFWDGYKDLSFWDTVYSDEKDWDYRKENATKYFTDICKGYRGDDPGPSPENIVNPQEIDLSSDEDEFVYESSVYPNALLPRLEDFCKYEDKMDLLESLFKNVPSPPYFPGSCPNEIKVGNDGNLWRSVLVEGPKYGNFGWDYFNKSPIYVWKNLETEETVSFDPDNWQHQLSSSGVGHKVNLGIGLTVDEKEDTVVDLINNIQLIRPAIPMSGNFEFIPNVNQVREDVMDVNYYNSKVPTIPYDKNGGVIPKKIICNIDSTTTDFIPRSYLGGGAKGRVYSYLPEGERFSNVGNSIAVKVIVSHPEDWRKKQYRYVSKLPFLARANAAANAAAASKAAAYSAMYFGSTYSVAAANAAADAAANAADAHAASNIEIPSSYLDNMARDKECMNTSEYFDELSIEDMEKLTSLLIYQRCITPTPLPIAELIPNDEIDRVLFDHMVTEDEQLNLLSKKYIKGKKTDLPDDVTVYDLYRSITVVVMERMSGTIEDLFKWFIVPRESKKKIVLEVQKALIFLWNHKRAYTDLKLPNVFFNILEGHKSGRNIKTPIRPEHLQIKLGDLGSICKANEFNITTYPAPFTWKSIYEYPENKQKWEGWDEWSQWMYLQECTEASMVWQLAVFTLFVLSPRTDHDVIRDQWNVLSFKLDTNRSAERYYDTYEKAIQDLGEIRDLLGILKEENRVAGLPIDNLQKVFSLEGRGVTLENIFQDS